MHIVFTPSLFLISPFCCCSLSRYEKVPQERYRLFLSEYSVSGALIKKKIKFSSYRKILSGAVAKSYMTNGLLIYGEIFSHYIRKPFRINDFATAPL
jgi:hypothetical protein